MEPAEREAYDRHIDAIMIQNDVLDTAKLEGLTEGKAERSIEVARNLKRLGIPTETIAESTGLSPAEIEKL